VGGPFKGMRYHGEARCSVPAPKIMGIYESELVPWLVKWSAIPFRHIINVGADEEYCAVGCAMLWPHATVTAFESSAEGRTLLTPSVKLKALQSRVKIMGLCGPQQLDAAVRNGEPTLVIMNVDGEEGKLLNPAEVPGLVNAHIIVEIHDYIDGRLGEIVSSKFKSSHVVEEVRTERRTFWDFHESRVLWLRLWLLPYLKQYANEFRPAPQRWFCCTPIGGDFINVQRGSDGAVRRPETRYCNWSKRPAGRSRDP
jgi:hypothetical protein